MALGILFAVLVGFSWVVTGAVVGLAEKNGYGAWRHQFIYTAMYGTVAIVVLCVGAALWPGKTAFSLRFNSAPALLVVLWGIFSYAQNICVGRGMRRGPNGIVWTIAQSGFVLPVVMGFALGNTQLTALRATGVLCVLTGVALCGKAKGTTARPQVSPHIGATAPPSVLAVAGDDCHRAAFGWLAPALLAFLFCGLNQCAQALASFYPEASRPSPLMRGLCGALGVLVAAAAHRAFVKGSAAGNDRHPAPQSYGFLIKICAINAVFFFLAGFCFHYNALDRLEAAGRISVANPVMLAACLVGFAIYGTVALHEKPPLLQLVGTAATILGAALIAA